MYICIYTYIWVSFGHGLEMNFMTGRKWIIIIANKQNLYQWSMVSRIRYTVFSNH